MASQRTPPLWLCLLLSIQPGAPRAGEVAIAVAANFAAPMKRIAVEFARDTGHVPTMAFGSTGQFHAQVRNGAPFDVLLAADHETPARLVAAGAAVAGTQMTYAVGRLVLWSAKPGVVDTAGEVLKRVAFERIAIANPKLAPYGTAAMQAMRALGVLDALRPRLVTGENVTQTYQFVATGNTTLGFVALSQVIQDGTIRQGSAWIVPAGLHDAIRQDAVVLARGRNNAAAEALLRYLRSDKAAAVIRSFGYER